MPSPRQVIVEAMDEENMMYNDDEGNADRIIAALHAAGYVIIKDRTDPEGGIPGRSESR